MEEEIKENTARHTVLAPEQIKTPPPSFLERAVSKYFEKRAENKISDSIQKYAMTSDGQIDNDLADYLRKKLTQRAQVSLHRDVLEPTGWTAISAGLLSTGVIAIDNKIEQKPFTKGNVMAVVASTGLGACLDLYRVKRRFDAGLNGALSGALNAKIEERTPRWDQRIMQESYTRDDDGHER